MKTSNHTHGVKCFVPARLVRTLQCIRSKAALPIVFLGRILNFHDLSACDHVVERLAILAEDSKEAKKEHQACQLANKH